MLTAGVGAQYETEDWGSWTAGVAKATNSLYGGWSYQTGYQLRVLHGLELSWLNQKRSGGFSDLGRYRDFSVDAGLARTRWAATLPLGRWGEVMSSFDMTRTGAGELHRSFGLSQQFWFSPNLRVSFTAGRQLETGNYDVGLGLAVPLF